MPSSNNAQTNTIMQPNNKNFSRRSFLKFVAGFLALFSIPGFGKIITSAKSKNQESEGSTYGTDTYGM